MTIWSGREGQWRRRAWALALWPWLLCWCGCPSALQPANTDGSSSTDNGSTSAKPGSQNSTDQLDFKGAISTASDIGWFDLGTLSPGDRLVADVQGTGGGLDPVAAIFDSRNELIALNDDRNPDGSNVNPLIDIIVRGQQDDYHLGVIAYPDTQTTGNFDAKVQITRGVGVPPADGQIEYLDWSGGNGIVVRNVGTFDLPPFSAADVGLPAAQTAALKARVRAIVADRYRGFNFTLLSSDDGPPPTAAHFTVYFGGDSPQAFAISEEINTFDAHPDDDLVVFTHSFDSVFGGSVTFEQMAQALGNTIAHETGHLLGLVHTADANDLMDTTAPNNRILAPQYFSTAPVDKSVFPFGVQPEQDILGWILGVAGQ